MNRQLEQRVVKLESATGGGSDVPRFILVRGIVAGVGQKETITRLTCDSDTIHRQPGEGEDDFINRAECYFARNSKPNWIGLMVSNVG